MSIQTIEFDFDPDLTRFLEEYYRVKKEIKHLSEDEDMPDDQKAFYLENTLRHLAYMNRIMKQAFEERTG